MVSSQEAFLHGPTYIAVAKAGDGGAGTTGPDIHEERSSRGEESGDRQERADP